MQIRQNRLATKQIGFSIIRPSFYKEGNKKKWVVMDSNHRSKKQQIYSLPHLATLETTPMWALTDSNRRPSACKADALNQLS